MVKDWVLSYCDQEQGKWLSSLLLKMVLEVRASRNKARKKKWIQVRKEETELSVFT